MRSQIVGLPIIAILAISSLAVAQLPNARPAPAVRPAPAPVPVEFQPAAGRAPDLNDLVLAKVDVTDDGPRVIMMIESYREEKRNVREARWAIEQRSREIEVDGKTVTQSYTVKIPVTDEWETTINVPVGPKHVTIDAEKFRFFNLDCELISIDEVAKKLTTLRPIFLIDQDNRDPQQLPKVAKRAMNEDCLIAVTQTKVRQLPTVFNRRARGFLRLKGRAIAPGEPLVPIPQFNPLP